MKITKRQLKEIIKEVISEAEQKFYARDPKGKKISVFTNKDNFKKAVKGGYEKVDSAEAEKELAGKGKEPEDKFAKYRGTSDAPPKPEAKPKVTKIAADPFDTDDDGRSSDADDEWTPGDDDVPSDPSFGPDPSDTDDDDGFDVGGPAYPNVPKGAKTSKQAKAMKNAEDMVDKLGGWEEDDDNYEINYPADEVEHVSSELDKAGVKYNLSYDKDVHGQKIGVWNIPKDQTKGAKTSKQAKAMSKEKPSGYDEYEEDDDGNYKYTGNDPKLKSLYKAYASVSGDDLDFGGSKSWSNAPISKQDYRKSAMKKFTEKQAKKIYAGLDAVRNDAHDTASASDSDEDWHRYYATDRIADDWSRIMNSQGGEYKQEESITSQLKREFKQYDNINKNLTRG